MDELPDNSEIITYTNAYGMSMLQVNVDASGTNQWSTFYRYDGNGRVIWQAQPSPSSSDTVLVTSITYDDAGRVYQTTDPKGLVDQTAYDNANRTVQTIASVSGSTGDDLNQTVNYTYTLDNQVSKMTLFN